MLKVISSTLAFLALSTVAVAIPASAQITPKLVDVAYPVSSQASADVETTESTQTKLSRKITREAEPLANPSRETAKAFQPAENRMINAAVSPKVENTKFVYKRRKDNTQTPVYFSEDAYKSR